MGFKKLFKMNTKIDGFFVNPKLFLDKETPILLSPLQAKKAEFGPILCCWKNKRDGTLTYNTIPVIDPKLVFQTNFIQHHTQLNPIHARADYWDVFYVASFPTYVQAGEIFKSLLALKKMRYQMKVKENKKLRRESYIDPSKEFTYGRYNPFISQEGVADLVESLSKSQYMNTPGLMGSVKIYWKEQENAGDQEKHWKPKTSQLLIEHKPLDFMGRDPYQAVLRVNDLAIDEWDMVNEPDSVIPEEEKYFDDEEEIPEETK